MNLKMLLLALALMVALAAAYVMFSQPAKINAPVKNEGPLSLSLDVKEYGMLDSGDRMRGYLTAFLEASGAENTSIEIIMLPSAPTLTVYEVDDYPIENEKSQIMQAAEDELQEYHINVETISSSEALGKQGSVIIIPTSALPQAIGTQGLKKMVSSNTVIFFGKPLDLGLDSSGSQEIIGDSAYSALGLSMQPDGTVEPASGSNVTLTKVGEAQVADYGSGWLMLFGDSSEPGTGQEIADAIIGQNWQAGRAESSFNISGNGTESFYSSEMPPGNYSMRIIARADGFEGSVYAIRDLLKAEPLQGRLSIDPSLRPGQDVQYSFKLHDNLSYPTHYDMSLSFSRDGQQVDSEKALAIVMQTVAIERGSVTPNLTAGSYIVKLVDQEGIVHAAAYTHVPDVKVRLVRIEGSLHIFTITVDDEPAALQKAELSVDGKENYSLSTDENGQIGTNFMLGPGMHKFDVMLDQESATTYYEKTDDGSLIYLVFLAGGLFLVASLFLRKGGGRLYSIRTFSRQGSKEKPLTIPRSVFMDLFSRTQQNRAPSLPLTVSDLRLGIRNHATYKGAPLFLTDSNLFSILEGLSRKGQLLSYNGYFLPSSMSKGKPIEYWTLCRIITDRLIENGIESEKWGEADFIIRGKPVHVWSGTTKPIKLCEGIIVFPDEARRQEFMASANAFDSDSMRLSLELHQGRISLQTLDEFLEWIPHAA